METKICINHYRYTQCCDCKNFVREHKNRRGRCSIDYEPVYTSNMSCNALKLTNRAEKASTIDLHTSDNYVEYFLIDRIVEKVIIHTENVLKEFR